jgi:hypothetical protein
MSKITGHNSFSLDKVNKTTFNTQNTRDMNIIHITDTPVFTDLSFATNIINGDGRLRYFEGSAVIEDAAEGIIRTTFYDVSGSPTGIEPTLFSFLSFCEKRGSSTRGVQYYTFSFPGEGLHYYDGIGFKTEQIDGTPVFISVDGCIYFE